MYPEMKKALQDFSAVLYSYKISYRVNLIYRGSVGT